MGKYFQNTDRRSFIAKALMGTASIGLLSTTNSMAATFLLPREVEEKAFVPADGANNPMGVPRGVVPGRVAWCHDPLACTWDGGCTQQPGADLKNVFRIPEIHCQPKERQKGLESRVQSLQPKQGKRLPSMGVHEHWNNPSEKKYSRNLGTGNGIELVLIT
jgi:hypothetical protein